MVMHVKMKNHHLCTSPPARIHIRCVSMLSNIGTVVPTPEGKASQRLSCFARGTVFVAHSLRGGHEQRHGDHLRRIREVGRQRWGGRRSLARGVAWHHSYFSYTPAQLRALHDSVQRYICTNTADTSHMFKKRRNLWFFVFTSALHDIYVPTHLR